MEPTETADDSPSWWEIVGGALLESIGYIGVVALCMVGGFVANLTRPANKIDPENALAELTEDFRIYVAGATIILFLVYLFARATLLDRPRKLELKAISVMVWLFGLFYIAGVVYVGFFFYYAGHFSRSLIVYSATLPPVVMLAFTHFLEVRKSESAHEFLPKIFYPAIAICFISFCLGWVLLNKNYRGQEVIYIFSTLLVGAFFLSFHRKTVVVTVTSISILMLFIIITSIILIDDIGLCLLIGFVWTFALGVAEVAKRAYQLKQGAIGAKGESRDFYIAGTNWSSILFLNLLVLLPIVVANTVMFGITVVVWALLFAWHLTDDEKKDGFIAHYCALAAGYLVPVIVIILMLAGRYSPIKDLIVLKAVPAAANVATQTDRLLTLLGVFLTLVFVLYPTEYRELRERLTSHSHFMNRRGCLLFAGATIALQAVLVTFIFSVLSASQQEELRELQFRVDLTLIIFIVELIAILVMLLMMGSTSGDAQTERALGDGGADGSSGPAAGDSVAGHAVMAGEMLGLAGVLIYRVGRLPVALIAGAATGAFVGVMRVDLPIWTVLLHAAVMALVTMAGFALNDAYDANKDRAAGAPGKPVAAGVMSPSQANAFAVCLIVVSALVEAAIGNGLSGLLVLSALVGVITYSPIAQILPSLKGFLTAALCCIPIAYASAVTGVAIPLWLYVFLATFVLGRELLLDLTDLHGDLRAGIRTLAARWHSNTSRVVGWSTMFASVAAMCMFSEGISRFFFLAGACSLLCAGYLALRDEPRGLIWTRVTLLLGVFAAPYST